jgi:hypothetical protein
MSIVNCQLPLVLRTRQALSLSYGRFFAEFLEEHSPVRLGLLDLPTCVGLRYGFDMLSLEVFLGSVLLRIPFGEPPGFRSA